MVSFSGIFVPFVILALSFILTFMLYKYFAQKKSGD